MTTRSLPTTIPKAVALLNRLSQKRWGPKAPRYFDSFRGVSPRTHFVHRHHQDISPFLPKDELFARGSKDHVLAKLHSAIRFAFESHD
jgi:hypothetical protein